MLTVFSRSPNFLQPSVYKYNLKFHLIRQRVLIEAAAEAAVVVVVVIIIVVVVIAAVEVAVVAVS